MRAAADRLHYSPHRGARSLITSRTLTIGVLLPDLYGEFFSEVIRGIDQTAQGAGYHCLLSSARHGGPTLEAAMRGQDVVYANLAGEMKRQAQRIVEAMHATGIKRLIFISSMGIHGEVPGERYGSQLDPYRDSAAVIEASDLDYTILRPGWFTRDDEISYQLTQKGEPFRGHDVSLNSLSDLIVKLATTPGLHVRRSLGVSRG